MRISDWSSDVCSSDLARGIRLAEVAEEALAADPAWEVVTQAALGVVTFRYNPAADASAVEALQGRIVEETMAAGYALVTSTVMRGRPALRLCTINPRTNDEALHEPVRLPAAPGNPQPPAWSKRGD